MEHLTFSHEQVLQLLPQRRSALLLDEISELVPGHYAVGRYLVNPDLDVLKGHFAGDPTLPGVYSMEAVNQLANVLIGVTPQFNGTPYVFFGTGEMCQLTSDLKGVVEGSLRHYFHREEDEKGLLEGTRVIKHNGTYYALLISHVYAPGRNRREVCYRTKDLNAKWEKTTILESDFGGFSHLAQGFAGLTETLCFKRFTTPKCLWFLTLLTRQSRGT
jgi:hypothetical protein